MPPALPAQPPVMHVCQLLDATAQALAQAGIPDPRLEAELLARHCLGMSRAELFLRSNDQVSEADHARLQALLTRRCRREPLQYIMGHCAFWDLDLEVGPAVLIPRPETEFLLEHVLALIAADQAAPPRRILDLCTGSGAIAAVLARELQPCQVIALDCSLVALGIARRNLARYGLIDQVHLVCADLLTPFSPAPIFDLIVSNPPYIKAGDIPGLEPEVRDWEPLLALSGGASGMQAVEMICAQAGPLLHPGAWLCIEIGADLAQESETALHKAGWYEQIQVVSDWAGRPRIAQARRTAAPGPINR